MERLKVYQYDRCGTCKKALKFLEVNKISYEPISIVENPPSKKEIKEMLKRLKKQGESIKKLFNTSGQAYREMELNRKLLHMNQNDIVDLLSTNGLLIKRPFILTDKLALVGFKEDKWEKLK